MAFIRRVKTSSGATAIQIAHKQHGRIIRIEHIGSGLINKAYLLAGIKGYVTNMDIPNEQIISAYHQLF
jgi:hypothetical protein